jgi:DNA gyrase subunit A
MKAIIYKKTTLESVFATQMRFVDMSVGKTNVYSLKEVMLHWLDNRRNIKRKWYINKFVNGKERMNILEVLILICEDIKLCDKIINLIRKSERDAVIELIHKKFPKISTTQALGIANMKISGLSKTALSEYRVEREGLKKDLKEWDSLIHSRKKIDKIIIDELTDAIRKYHKPRRSRIEKYHASKEENAMVSDRDYVLVFTAHSNIKKLPADVESIGELMPGDDPVQTIRINNRESIILFDKQGFVHCLNVSDIPETSLKSRGLNLSQYVSINGEIISIIPKKDITAKSHFVFITKNGFIKKTECSQYAFKSSVKGIVFKDKSDELVSVIHGKASNNIIIYTKRGFGIRFNTSDFSATSRAAAGVIAMNLEGKDYVLGMTPVSKADTHIMIMTEKGFGKVSSLDSFNTSKRRGEVVILTSLNKDDSIMTVKACHPDDNFLFIMKERVDKIPFDEFPELTRQHRGKKLITVRKGEQIIRCLKNA